MKLVAFLALACGGFGPALAAEYPASVADLFGTPDNLRTIREADKIDACLLRHINATTRPDGRVDWKTERYEETTFVPVPAATAKELRELLLNNQTYDWSDRGGHRPQLYLRLRFHRDAKVLTLDFCFICQVVVVTRPDESPGQASFAPNADLLVQAFRKVFPDDAALRQVAKEAGLPL